MWIVAASIATHVVVIEALWSPSHGASAGPAAPVATLPDVAEATDEPAPLEAVLLDDEQLARILAASMPAAGVSAASPSAASPPGAALADSPATQSPTASLPELVAAVEKAEPQAIASGIDATPSTTEPRAVATDPMASTPCESPDCRPGAGDAAAIATAPPIEIRRGGGELAFASSQHAIDTGVGPAIDPTPGTPVDSTPGPGTGKPDRFQRMRFGPQYESSIAGLIDRAVDMEPGTPPPKLVPSGRLSPDGGGTARGGTGEFDAKVARDGTVAFTDAPNVQLGPRPGPPVTKFGITLLSFDVGDAMMRRHGMDPYASAKLKFLDQTREERYEMGLAYRKEQLANTGPLMRGNIARVFTVLVDHAAQRRALFELWDECEDTEEGRLAQNLVVGAIRTHFPAGTPDAYSAREIAGFPKHSSIAFVPYE